MQYENKNYTEEQIQAGLDDANLETAIQARIGLISQGIEVGDVVSLKSGGATMTVTRVISEDPAFLECTWTDKWLAPHDLRLPTTCVYKRKGAEA